MYVCLTVCSRVSQRWKCHQWTVVHHALNAPQRHREHLRPHWPLPQPMLPVQCRCRRGQPLYTDSQMNSGLHPRPAVAGPSHLHVTTSVVFVSPFLQLDAPYVLCSLLWWQDGDVAFAILVWPRVTICSCCSVAKIWFGLTVWLFVCITVSICLFCSWQLVSGTGIPSSAGSSKSSTSDNTDSSKCHSSSASLVHLFLLFYRVCRNKWSGNIKHS